MFDSDLIHNRALTEQACAMHPPYPQHIGDFFTGEQVPTGAIVQEDGSVLFRLYAPQMDTARVALKSFPDTAMDMQKDERGFFTATLPYDPRHRGPQDVHFFLNGMPYLHPQMPTHYRSFRQINFVELPDPESEMILLRDVEHGQVVRETFFSPTHASWQRMQIYLPPQYRRGGVFPVLYLQHGYTENENEWVNMGKLPYLMDNLITDGKCVPFLVVMCDGMERLPGEDKWDFSSFSQMLLEDVIPFVEKNYRVIPEKKGRAMAGLSMGSEQTAVIGLTHPEVFSSLGLFSGFMRLDTNAPFFSCPHLRVLKEQPDFLRKHFSVFFRAIGREDVYYPVFLENQAHLEEVGALGFDGYRERVYEDMTHDWGAFRRGMRDFAQLIFRD